MGFFDFFKTKPSVSPAQLAQAEDLFYQGVQLAGLQKKTLEGLACYEKSLALNEDAACLMNIASIYRQQVRHVEAEELLRRAKRCPASKKRFDESVLDKQLAQVVEVTNIYHDLKKRSLLLDDLRKHGHKYVAKEIYRGLLSCHREKFIRFFFYDEIDSILRFDYVEQYRNIQHLLRYYTTDSLAEHLRANLLFTAQYEVIRKSVYAFFNVYRRKDLCAIRGLLLLHIQDTLGLYD